MTDPRADLTAVAMEAAGNWYHAWFTGTVLYAVSRHGTEATADLVFRIFRQQQMDTFLPGLRKLGLDQMSPAVAAARYHYLSNAIGGVGVEYVEESPRKAWIRYPPPRWIWAGTAICGIPSEVNAAMLRGWHANNGVMLGRLGLGFVCTGQTVDGAPGLEGYYIEHERELAPDERLRFSHEEHMPPADAARLPTLETSSWPPVRLAKAKRNYAMEYARSLMRAAEAARGPTDGAQLVGAAARLIGMQYYAQTAAQLGVASEPGDLSAYTQFVERLIAATGDTATTEHRADGAKVITWRTPRLFANLQISDDMRRAAAELLAGALAAHDRFARLATATTADGSLVLTLAR